MSVLTAILDEINSLHPTSGSPQISRAQLVSTLTDMAVGLEDDDPLNLARLNNVTDCTSELQAALDYCFGASSAPHLDAAEAILNKPFVLPPGQYNITAPLRVTSVMGGELRGAGRFATTITNTSGTDVFVTDGFEYSRVSGMHLHCPGTTATVFNLDWTSAGTALQSNTFSDMYFSGGRVGVGIGYSGYMGSETLFINCFFGVNADAGIYTANFNALQTTVIGGNFQGCGVGIWVAVGSAPGIFSVGFQQNVNWDIRVDNSANDTYSINGCRSESANFAKIGNGPNTVISGCTQINGADGFFADCSTPLIIQGCRSLNGKVRNHELFGTTVDRSSFARDDWWLGQGNLVVDGIGNKVQAGSSFTLTQKFITDALLVGEGGTVPWTVTIPLDANALLPIPIGVKINIVQNDAHQITVAAETGVELHTSRSLTTRTQYSVITLTKLGADEWIVSGDLT